MPLIIPLIPQSDSIHVVPTLPSPIVLFLHDQCCCLQVNSFGVKHQNEASRGGFQLDNLLPSLPQHLRALLTQPIDEAKSLAAYNRPQYQAPRPHHY